jgi:NarL family two-component system response regulator LiaR
VSEPISVVLVEDHALTRAGLRMALEAAGIRVAAETADGMYAEELIVREQPNVAVIDIGLPGRGGIELTRALRGSAPNTRVVMLTMRETEDDVLEALGAGAVAYCVKSSDTKTAVDAVRIVAGGGAYFDPRIADAVLKRLGVPPRPEGDCPLSPRELDILRLMVDGVGNAGIAERLHLGFGTVKGHVRDILEKLAATDRTQAAVNAVRRGYI